ncbi:DUF6519 domain-containing protein [Microbacterium sp. NPDC019599]|uniref:DUF6519 domain-containing protein n=1 Tax=Microbacterium sp. NPDC019599 TaxID=3154690 RepID=UPI0033D28EC3
MRGDFSRRTHDRRKQYSAVLNEQGRLLTDADLEEEHRILAGAHEQTAADVVGEAGAPLAAAGFQITDDGAGGLRIGAGRYYVDGILVENLPAKEGDAFIPFAGQPFLHDAGKDLDGLSDGVHPVVLDVWRRLVTPLDDPSLREVALGGPTTASREQTAWQVRVLDRAADWTCAAAVPVVPITSGRLAARATPEAAVKTPCLVPARAGYSGLENQLYRVEVLSSGAAHDIGTAGATAVTVKTGTTDQIDLGTSPLPAVGSFVELVRSGAGADPFDSTFSQVTAVTDSVVTLATPVPALAPGETLALRTPDAIAVMSRENGSVVTGVEAINGQTVRVADLGPDGTLGFAPRQWVEITDDSIEFDSRLPRRLYFITAIDADERTVKLATPADTLGGTEGVDRARHPKLRRWDGATGIWFRKSSAGWMHLESGIEVSFAAGKYLRDDYWSFPARTAVIDDRSGNIEWPQVGGDPASLPPDGIVRHRAALALLRVTGGKGKIEGDCRDLFPPLTELTNLLYVGGDGQEARRHDPGFPALPKLLEVRVVNGETPVANAVVRFAPDNGVGVDVLTTEQGIASFTWALQPPANAISPVPPPPQVCTAHLLDHAANPIANQFVRFTATIQDLTTLLYVSGDGQEARVGDASFPRLQQPVVVRVSNGAYPVEGATVEFVAAQGAVTSVNPVVTGPDGTASAVWDLDRTVPDMQAVTAFLHEADGTPSRHQRITFLARIDPASEGNGGCCTSIGDGADFPRIEEALEALIGRGVRDICLCLLPGDHRVEAAIVDQPINLSIRGCGRTSRVHVADRFDFAGLLSLRLADLDLRYPVQLHHDVRGQGVLFVRDTADVRLDNVHVFGRSAARTLVTIRGGRRVEVLDSVIEVFRLAPIQPLFDRLDTTVTNNARRWPTLNTVVDGLSRAFDAVGSPEFETRSDELNTAMEGVSSAARRRLAEAMRAWTGEPDVSPEVAGDVVRIADAFEVDDVALRNLPDRILELSNRAETSPDFLSGWAALEIAPSARLGDDGAGPAEVVIHHNLIYGDVTFYGRPAGSTEILDSIRDRFEEAINQGGIVRGDFGTVNFSGNHLGRLRVSDEMLALLQRFVDDQGGGQLPVYRSFLISDNVFDGTGWVGPLNPAVVGRHVGLTGNHFTLAGFGQDGATATALEVVALAAAVTGNLGEPADARRGPALATIDVTAARWSDVGNVDLSVV